MYISGYRLQPLVIAVTLLAAIAAATLAAIAIKRGRHPRRSIPEAALLWVLATITAMSLEPDSGRDGAGSCSFALDYEFAFVINQRTLNQALYIPLGLLAVMIARSTRQRIAAVGAALALSMVFELLQSTESIGRSCDITDVIDNGIGIAIGVGLGTVFTMIPRLTTSFSGRPTIEP